MLDRIHQMNTLTNSSGGKRSLLVISVYYFALLLIAVSWTQRGLIAPDTWLRVLFILFFTVPLLRYRYFAPTAITVFASIRLFSVAPYGYLPTEPIYYFAFAIVLYLIDVSIKNNAQNKAISRSRSGIGLIVFLMIVLLSNLVNQVDQLDYLYLLATSIVLSKFIRRGDDLALMEMGFMIVTFCLSIYALVFRDDFIVREYVSTKIIEIAYWTDPNYLGCVLSIGIVVSFYYFMNRVKDIGVLRVLYLVVFIIGFLTLGLLASRSAFLAAIIPTLYILYKKTSSIKNLIFVILFIGIVVVFLSNTNYFDSLIARFNDSDPTGSGRTVIWENSFSRFIRSDTSLLLFGGGTDYANSLCGQSINMAIASPHNNYLAVLYDYGIVGLIAFLAILFSWFKMNIHNVLPVSLILVFAIMCFSLVPLMYLPFWFLVVLIEKQDVGRKPRVVRWDRSRYSWQNQWRTRRLSFLTSRGSMKAQ